MFLVKLSLERPVLTTVAILVFIIFGGLAYFGLNLNQMPDVEIPFVTVSTVYPGAGPKEVENLITKRIEDAVSTISGIKRIESYCLDGVGITLLEFRLDKDVNVANQEVKDKVETILNQLPDEAKKPIIQKFDFSAFPIIDLVLNGPVGPRELYELADKKIKDRLSQISGVANVNITGGQKREIRVVMDDKVIYENKISLPQMLQLLGAQNLDIPGGYFQNTEEEYSVRFKGQFSSVDEIRNLLVHTPYGNKRLSQIADVQDSGKDIRLRSIYFDAGTKIRDENVVRLSIIKSTDGNVVKVADAVKAILPELQASLPDGIKLTMVNDKSEFTRSTVDDTMSNIILGVIFTSIVLFLFLGDIRSTLIVALSMPASIIATFWALQLFDLTLNIMTLMGLSVSVGVLVANSVVVLENIFRHKNLGLDSKESALTGTTEIAVAVIAATATNLVVFLPIANMSSIVGRFLRELALAASFATIFSLLFSFTLTPMLANLMIGKKEKEGKFKIKLNEFYAKWDSFYSKLLEKALKNKFVAFLIVAGSFLLLVLSVIVYGPNLGFDFIPHSDDGRISITAELPQEYNMKETAKTLKQIEDRIKKHKEVVHILTDLGKIDNLNTGTNMARMEVKLVDQSERDLKLQDMINIFVAELADIPNVKITVDYGSKQGQQGAPIQFFVLGQNLNKLEELKNTIFEKIKDVPGLINLDQSSRKGKPEITIIPKRVKLAQTGITAQEIALTVRAAIEGMQTSKYREAGNEYDITITLNENSVNSPEKIASIPIVARNGVVYRIAQLADVKFTKGFSKILHRDKYAAIQFTGSPTPGTPLGDVTSEIDRRLKEINLPQGYKIKWTGNVEMMNEMLADFAFAFILAMVLTYMLLAAILESFIQPFFILLTVPLALIGVLASLFYTNIPFAITSLMAIVMLIGIVVNNAILMLDYTNQLVREKGMKIRDALIRACPTKLKPIIMSTLAIILGMLPMAIGIGAAGKEMRMPLGVVSVGGLIVSTVLTLFVVPAFYYLVSKERRQNS